MEMASSQNIRMTSHFCSGSTKFTLFKLNDLGSLKLGVFQFAEIPIP
jgi:hypothetical protein